MAETEDQTGTTPPSPTKRSVPHVAQLARELAAYQNAVNGAELAESLLNSSGLATAAASLFALLGVNPKVIGELTGKAAQAALDKYAPLKDADGDE